MNYPTKEQVMDADKFRLAIWQRFLPSPGMNFIDENNFREKLEEEVEIQNLISYRFRELGGWTPQLSKEIGF